MELKEGSTYIDLTVNEGKRKYRNIDIDVKIDTNRISFSSVVKTDSQDIDSPYKFIKDPFSIRPSDVVKAIKESLKIDGEHIRRLNLR